MVDAYSRASRWSESEALCLYRGVGVAATIWVLVVMITTAGDKQYVPSVEFTGADASTRCFNEANALTRQLMAQNRGWAMCVPKEAVERLVPKQKQ